MHLRVPHGCGRTPYGLQSLAECCWPDAYYVVGDGPYALLARCDLFTVTLYETVAEARHRRKRLDAVAATRSARALTRSPHSSMLATPGSRFPCPFPEDCDGLAPPLLEGSVPSSFRTRAGTVDDVVVQNSDDAGRRARLERERAFHDDRFADEHRQAASKYYAVDTGRARYVAVVEEAAEPGRVVLEYGCGTGSKAFELARAGARVTGIDISGVGVAEARSRAEQERVRAEFVQMDAEQLGYRAGSFDVVCGSGILHHLDIDRSLAEVQRILKPGGVAVFYEPLGTNPIINLYRRLTPSMRTPDEHPLVPADFAGMRERFGAVDVSYHNFLALGGAVLRKVPGIGGPLVRLLQHLDGVLFRALPASRRLAWVVVVRLQA